MDCLKMERNEWTELFVDEARELHKVPLKCDWTEVGQVFPTLYKNKHQHVILKLFKDPDSKLQNYFIEAYHILKSCDHKHIITAYFFGQTKPECHPFFTMEVAEQDMFQLLTSKKGGDFEYPTDSTGSSDEHYTMSHCMTWMRQVSDALSYLHGQKKPILHRDVKAKNILMFNNSTLCKLCDFDDCRYLAAEMSAGVGTQSHMAPEVAKQRNQSKGKYSETCDCYSFGVTVLEMIFRNAPLDIPNCTEADYTDTVFKWFTSSDESPGYKNIDLKSAVFDLVAHEKKFAIIYSILTSVLQADQTTRMPARDILAALQNSVAEPHFWSPPDLVPQATDDAIPSRHSHQTTLSSTRRSAYVTYKASLRDGAFDSHLASHMETVLNAIGDRVNTKAATDPNLPLNARHSFKVTGGTYSGVLTIEHGIGGESASSIKSYCEQNSHRRHTDWLAEQFKEDNNVMLRMLQFSVWLPEQ